MSSRHAAQVGFGVLVLWGIGLAIRIGQAEERAAAPKLIPLPASVAAPAENPSSPPRVALGQRLFFDPRLSGDNQMSCATCHLPEKSLADGQARSKGAGGVLLTRNTPSLWNVGFYGSYFWDGRATSLEEQALGPIESPQEMNQALGELEQELAAVPEYVEQFQQAFGGPVVDDRVKRPVTRQRIAQALAAFERTLVTRNSPFDRYLAGDKSALSAEAKRGLELFIGDADCIRCHHGPLLSDGKFYRLGVSFHDRGRATVTGKQEDAYAFRTPSLRDVARTGPYMHDGSLLTLDDVVLFYLRLVPAATPDGQPLDIEPRQSVSVSDVPALVAFLESLSGEPAVEIKK